MMNKISKHMHALCLAAYETAERFNMHDAVVAVDHGGHIVAMLRADQAPFAAIEAARRKAVAAAALKMSTANALEMLKQDPLVVTALSASGDMLIVPGGFPIFLDNNCVGGLGIAGGHYSEDDVVGREVLERKSA